MSQDNTKSPQDKMKDLVALCKRRGFVFGASEIYDGINGFWDYGPLGTQLKKNLADAWWHDMVECPPVGPDGTVLEVVGVDSSIIQNPKVWVASGHVAGFNDPMVDCKETKKRYRADHVHVFIPKDGSETWVAAMEGDEKAEKRLQKLIHSSAKRDDFEVKPLTEIAVSDFSKIIAPDTREKGTLTEPKDFNLMFHTYVGATASDDNKAYLRPETAQGIFTNFKNVVDSSRVKMPFGIAQIGKAFRNEVTPRNFIFRSREFEQMEIEWFCREDDAQKWFDFWVEARRQWWKSMGLKDENILMRPHEKDELAHYAKEGAGCIDVEFKFPFTDPDYGELEGIAHRSNYDLTKHAEVSGKKVGYQDPTTNEYFIPHVIEPSAGLTRGVLAILANAFTYDESRPSKMYMNFHPRLAPVQVAVLPLIGKDEDQMKVASDLYMTLRQTYATEIDVKQNIGKRYARQDEIGTPFCITVDADTQSDQAVTVRHRNTMDQDRVAISDLNTYLHNKIETFLT